MNVDLTSRRNDDNSLHGYAPGRNGPIWEAHKQVTHPEELHLAASMIPQKPKLLQTPLAEDVEGDMGVTRKSMKKARSQRGQKVAPSPLPTADCCWPPTPKNRRSGARFQGEGTQ